MHCPGCGANNENGARFCATCGQKLEYGVGDLSPKVPDSPLPNPEELPKPPGKGMSIASLVLGILAALPFGWFAGIPAIVLGAIAIVKKRPGRGMALTGLVMGAVAPILSTLIFFAVLPGVVHSKERAREAGVQQSMLVIQAAFEGYAANRGYYPDEDDWSFAGGLARSYLPGGEPGVVTDDGNPVVGLLPRNPFTGTEYVYGEDFFYFPSQLDSGMNTIVLEDDELCPYAGYEAPQGRPGTIVAFGYSDTTMREPIVIEYGIFGYGRETDNPLTESDADGNVVYHVLVGSLESGEPSMGDTLVE